MQATGWVARRWAQVIGKAPTTWDAIRRRRLIGEAQGDGPVSGQLQQVSPTAWLVGEEPDETAVRSHSQWALVWYRLRHDQTALLGAAIVLFLIALDMVRGSILATRDHPSVIVNSVANEPVSTPDRGVPSTTRQLVPAMVSGGSKRKSTSSSSGGARSS